MAGRYVDGGWLNGSLVRRASKRHSCDFWMGKAHCPQPILIGESYAEGDPNYAAGGYQQDRICLMHLEGGEIANG